MLDALSARPRPSLFLTFQRSLFQRDFKSDGASTAAHWPPPWQGGLRSTTRVRCERGPRATEGNALLCSDEARSAVRCWPCGGGGWQLLLSSKPLQTWRI